jgi:transcriptional regulator with XRE-family HTH domain
MEQPKRNAVGIQIRRLRDSQGISQQRLATLCSLAGYEITRSTLAKIEAEIRAVSDVELFVISQALRLKMDDLFPPGFEKSLKKNQVVPFHIRREKVKRTGQ